MILLRILPFALHPLFHLARTHFATWSASHICTDQPAKILNNIPPYSKPLVYSHTQHSTIHLSLLVYSSTKHWCLKQPYFLTKCTGPWPVLLSFHLLTLQLWLTANLRFKSPNFQLHCLLCSGVVKLAEKKVIQEVNVSPSSGITFYPSLYIFIKNSLEFDCFWLHLVPRIVIKSVFITRLSLVLKLFLVIPIAKLYALVKKISGLNSCDTWTLLFTLIFCII